MKKILLLVTIGCLMIAGSTICHAQKSGGKSTDQFVLMMDTAQDVSSWKTVSEQLQKSADQNTTDWLSQYNASFALSIYAMQISDMKKRDNKLDQALKYADNADVLKANESENYVLKGMVTAMKISVDPSRGMDMGRESQELLRKGKELNPENPRAYLELGESAMYTPEQYGGGKKKAEGLLEMSVEKFKKAKSENINYPHWGEKRAETLLEKCKTL